jgi:general secretion pathway protein D
MKIQNTLMMTALCMILSTAASAAQLKCKTLPLCISQVSKFTKQQYTLGTKLVAPNFQEVNFNGDTQSIDKLLSQLLFNYGYTRVPSIDNSWMVIATRDIRYNPTPLLDSQKDEIPNNYDYVMASYQLKNKYQANAITRAFRPFMSRYGRIISMKESGKIVIQDTGVNIKRLMGLVKLSDVEPTAKDLRELRERERFNRKVKLMEAKSPKCDSKK